jgi:NADH-quinone oxidoreductase subunit J
MHQTALVHQTVLNHQAVLNHQTVLAIARTGTSEAVVFWILGPLAVLAALAMVLARSAVHAALLLAFVMVCLATFYAAQDAPFLAFVQVIVYTGAIMMLFLFVLMLVGVSSADSLVETLRGQRVAAALFGLGLVVLLVVGIGHAVDTMTNTGLTRANAADGGNPQGLAHLIFTRYVFAFEATSALLITAALGAMVLAHKERLVARPSQRQLAEQRFAGPRPSPLPGPGVYADHDAVDTPALLPDGSIAPGSVNPYLERVSAGRQPRPEPLPLDDGEAQP